MTRDTVLRNYATCRHMALFLATLLVNWQAKGSSAFIVTNPAIKQATQPSRSFIAIYPHIAGTTLVCRSTSTQGLLLSDASQGDVVSAAEESPADAIEEEEASSDDELVNQKSELADIDNVDDVDEKNASSDQDAKQAVQKERHTVFVGNLPFETTEAGLRDLFSEYGTVELVSIPKKPESGQPRGFAFVDMSSAEETQRVVDSLNGADVSGRKIRVQISLPKEQADKQNMQFAQGRKGDGMQKIYVGNLPFDATAESVLELFSKYGEVKDVIFPLDRDTGKTRGFAFISLKTEEAETAIAEVNGTECGGRTLTVSVPIPVGAKPSYQKRKPQQKLYVGNLSFYTSPDTLRELFEEFGPVHDCYMPEDPATGGSRGFGFVTLDKEAATKAADAIDGIEVDGRMIRVNFSQPKRSQPRGDGNSFDDA